MRTPKTRTHMTNTTRSGYLNKIVTMRPKNSEPHHLNCFTKIKSCNKRNFLICPHPPFLLGTPMICEILRSMNHSSNATLHFLWTERLCDFKTPIIRSLCLLASFTFYIKYKSFYLISLSISIDNYT